MRSELNHFICLIRQFEPVAPATLRLISAGDWIIQMSRLRLSLRRRTHWSLDALQPVTNIRYPMLAY